MPQLIIALWLMWGSWGISETHTPLFGTVVGVADDDTLNVRSRPHYRAPKIGSIPPISTVGITKCRHIGHTHWCLIHPIAQNGYDGPSGWVNARYLKTYNHGYVLIDNKAKCTYALSCSGNSCDVITDFRQDKDYNIIGLIHRKIPRSHLRAAGRFDGMGDEEGGYCVADHWIDDYLMRIKNIAKSPKALAQQAASWIYTGDIDSLARHIHPIHGVKISWQTDFRHPRSHTFVADTLSRIWHGHKILSWGVAEARGDTIKLDLHTVLEHMVHRPQNITQNKTCDYRGFTVHHSHPMACREIFWADQDTKTHDHDWLGLMIILEQDNGQWFVVGLLHDRWTI